MFLPDRARPDRPKYASPGRSASVALGQWMEPTIALNGRDIVREMGGSRCAKCCPNDISRRLNYFEDPYFGKMSALRARRLFDEIRHQADAQGYCLAKELLNLEPRDLEPRDAATARHRPSPRTGPARAPVEHLTCPAFEGAQDAGQSNKDCSQ